jgi:protein-S-isoprenylcysteine O-methyltransferase Ste14
MMVGSPPALDSWWGLIVIPPSAILLGLRILNEEQMLCDQLAGYREYRNRVLYRPIPYTW